MKAGIIVCAMAAAALSAFGETAQKGSCISKAIALKSSQTATLVNEYDPEEKEFYDSGVAYYTMTLKRGVAYTVWITGGSAVNIDLDVDTHETYYDDRDDEPLAGFSVDEINGGATKVAYLYADDWDLGEDGDPPSGKYQVVLTGDIGASTTLGFTTGIRTFTMVGTEESPKSITMSKSMKTFSGKLIDGSYYFRASLKAGNKYRIRTQGGTSANPLSLWADGVSASADAGASTDEGWLVNANNDALVLVPDTSGLYEFVVDGTGSQSFKFQYQMVPTRSITAHPSIPLLKENGYSATFVPGRIANTHNYYDSIIDEHLCKMYLNKGERWVFETEGSTNAIRMVVYDPSGKVLVTNETSDGDDFDTRAVVTATAAGVYYVGVCDPLLDVTDEPNGSTIVLTARNTTSVMDADGYDPVDDVYATANLVVPYPATTNDTAVALTTLEQNRADAEALGAIHGPHRFNAADLYDVFEFPCRKGYTYKLRASFVDTNDVTKLTLGAKLFTIQKGKERNITYKGTISPAYNEKYVLAEDLTFKADTNAVHYLRVWVANGKGLDFPAYNIHAIVADGMNALGVVKPLSKGAAGSWSIGSEKFSYPFGVALAVAPSELTIKANALPGFSAPATAVVTVPAYMGVDDVATVTHEYSDIYDAKYQTGTKTTTKNGKKTTTKLYSPEGGDNTPAGAFAIVPKAAATTLVRTLWNGDPADHFSFTASDNVYYNFSLANTLDDGSGDAVIVVSNATAGVVGEYTNVTEISRALLPAGTTYVVVTHGTDAKADSAYSITYSKAAGGVVRFSNAKGTAAVTTYTVSEGAATATLYVQRTGSEGAMRVKYATQAGTALPGTNYYPIVTNELSWAAGDKSVKAVKVRLLPDAQPKWEASDKSFTVRLYPIDEYDLAAGEYLAIVPKDTATVTIKESSAKKPGTVSLAKYGATAVANVKSPSVTGTAGQDLELTFSRTGGSDGPVAIKVASPTAAVAKKNKDTAVAGTDYAPFAETLEWADGDADDKQLVVSLKDSTGYVASKKFVFTISAVKTDGTLPTLSAKTATMTILNDTVAQTSAAYAKTIPASTGLALASTGTWFKDYDGTLRSASAGGTVTYTLTGPGFFACEPQIVTNSETDVATLTCKVYNKTAKLNETVPNVEGRFVRILPAGTTTVTFTLSGVKGGAYAKFAPQEDGSPYVWGRFADVTSAAWSKDGMPALMDKSVVKKDDVQTLAWTLPAVLAAESNLYCRVRLGTTAKPTEVHGYDKDHAEAVPPEDFSYEEGKTYYWALDYAYTDAASPSYGDLKELNWTPGPSTWTFSTLKAGLPVSTVRDSCVDAAGKSIEDLLADGDPVELIQFVQPNFDLDGEGEGEGALSANIFRLVGGSLPKGLSLNSTTGVIEGAPTTPGIYTALLQSGNRTSKTVTKKVNGKTKKVTTNTDVYGTTIPVTFNVLPAGTLIGSFRGVLSEANGELEYDARRLGLLTVTTSVNAKKQKCEITAKATIGGIAYTFTGTQGFEELLDRDETLPGCTRHVQVALKSAVKKLNSKKKVVASDTAMLTLTLGDGALTNAVALAEAAGTAELTINVLNSARTAWVEDMDYTANLYRNNGGTELGSSALAGGFEGYYTSALAPEGVSAADGIPVGNGYLTFTVQKTGVVKVAGCLADGTSVSFSSIGQVVGDSLDNPSDCTLVVPVYAGSASYALGGEVKIEITDAGDYPVVLPSSKLTWEKNASSLTSRDGSAFAISTAPTGGWYDKVVNLQNYYLNRGFAISTIEDSDELPAEALTSGYSFSTLSSPNDLEVTFAGNAMSVAARSLVKNKTTGLSDFGTSVNPWNTTVKFTRATGIVTGTFNAWEWIVKSDLANEYATAQKQIASLSHKGVLLFSRDNSTESPLADTVLTSGFFLMPATSSTKAATKKAAWKASLPFNILTVEDDEKSWEEKEFDE